MISDVTALSSKGQVVLPKAIRDALALSPGSRLMVFSDGDNTKANQATRYIRIQYVNG